MIDSSVVRFGYPRRCRRRDFPFAEQSTPALPGRRKSKGNRGAVAHRSGVAPTPVLQARGAGQHCFRSGVVEGTAPARTGRDLTSLSARSPLLAAPLVEQGLRRHRPSGHGCASDRCEVEDDPSSSVCWRKLATPACSTVWCRSRAAASNCRSLPSCQISKRSVSPG